MRLIFLISICLLLMIGGEVNAQDNPQSHVVDCNALIEGEIEYDLEPFEFTDICSLGFDCHSLEGLECHFQLASKLAERCDLNDLFCRNGAFLASAAIDIQTSIEFPIFIRYEPLVEAFPVVLTAYAEKDFATALATLQDPSIISGYPHPVTYLSRGLLYEMLDQPDEALEEYDELLKWLSEYALVHYVRGLLLGRIGRNLEASFETAWLEDYLTAFAPDLLSLVEPLQESNPFDYSELTTWMKYSVMMNYSSSGGESFDDLTQVEATPVKIAIYDEPAVLFAQDVSMLRYPRFSGDVLNTYVLNKMDQGKYVYDFHVEWGGPNTLNLELSDGLIFGTEYTPGAESFGKIEFILAPINAPDPREAFGKPMCEGGVVSRLTAGIYLEEPLGYPYLPRVENAGDEFDMYNLVDPFHFPLRIYDEFVCIGSTLWWKIIDENGDTGWFPENEGNEYLIHPRTLLDTLFYCPTAPRTRLFSLGEAKVLAGFGANNIRMEAGRSAEIIAQVPEGDKFSVKYGPVCADGMAWWNVQYREITGWTAEGSSDTYWLEPVLNW